MAVTLNDCDDHLPLCMHFKNGIDTKYTQLRFENG